MVEKTALPTIPLLRGDNYYNWRVKMESMLQLKRLLCVLIQDRPTGDNKRKEKAEFDEKNADAVACIRLSLNDEQVLQFASYTNAKQLWQAIRDVYTGPAEDRTIDAGEELRNIRMLDDETTTEYMNRARGLSVKCNEAGMVISEQQLVYNVVRGLHPRFGQIREIFKTQREKRLDEVLEILKEKKRETQMKISGNTSNTDNQEKAYISRDRQKKPNVRKCYVCGKLGHITKDCYQRKDKSGHKNSGNRGKYTHDNNRSNFIIKRANYVSNKREDSINFQTFNANVCP